MKRLLVLSVGLLASASVFGETAPMQVSKPTTPVVVDPVKKVMEKKECKARLPYGDVASVMLDGTVQDIVGLLSKDFASKLNQLGEIVKRTEKLDIDLCNFGETGKSLMSKLSCVKAGKMTKQGPREIVCAPFGCSGSKTDCVKKALQDLRTMLQMLFEDLFIGYKDGSTQVPGMAFLLLDVAGQSNVENSLKTDVVPVLEKILNVLGAIEKILPADKR